MCLYGMTLVLERQTTLCQETSSLCFHKMTESFFKKQNNNKTHYNDTAAVAVKSGGIV